MERNIITQMAQIANKIVQEKTYLTSYVGDLIHDGAIIQRAPEGRVYYWELKSNGCGTWLFDKPVNVGLDSPSVMYIIKIENITDNLQREGTVTLHYRPNKIL